MHDPMKIVIDQNIPGVNETFAHHGRVFTVDGRHISKLHLRDATALIVRSVTSVNQDLLENTSIEFVGTATIGTDHLDIPWLQQRGIRWASAPGCNANAAAQYTLAMMVLASQRLGFPLSKRSVGIVGHGNVGSRVHQLLRSYGLRRLRVCDPPLADAGQAGLCGMEEISNCDVITFHVPLTPNGPYATRNLVDERFLSRLRTGTLLVNTSRGKVTERRALRRWLVSGQGHAAIDVWPDEPHIDLETLEAATVATPHVAGYSLEGKLRGTEMVYTQFCDWLKVPPVDRGLLSGPGIDIGAESVWLKLEDAIFSACPVIRDDAQLRKLKSINPDKRAAYFDKLRRNYPERHDFCAWRVPPATPQMLAKKLKTLGFH